MLAPNTALQMLVKEIMCTCYILWPRLLAAADGSYLLQAILKMLAFRGYELLVACVHKRSLQKQILQA